jgi:hypothetical protein
MLQTSVVNRFVGCKYSYQYLSNINIRGAGLQLAQFGITEMKESQNRKPDPRCFGQGYSFAYEAPALSVTFSSDDISVRRTLDLTGRGQAAPKITGADEHESHAIPRSG